MRITIETDDKDKAKVANVDPSEKEAVSVTVVDSGQGLGSQSQIGSNGTDFSIDGERPLQSDIIDAGEVPSELIDLMARVESTKTDDSKNIDSGAGPRQ